jgi:hypothetical protein
LEAALFVVDVVVVVTAVTESSARTTCALVKQMANALISDRVRDIFLTNMKEDLGCKAVLDLI